MEKGVEMVGLMQKLLLDMVESREGADALCEVRRRAQVPQDKEYHINEVYDDEEWQCLFAASFDVLHLTQEQMEKDFADFFLKDAQARWPMWYKMSKSAREFLLRQPKIHNGFATSQNDPALRSAIDDKFVVEERSGDLVIHYKSPNQLCGLYTELARSIINFYGDNAVVEEARCAKSGEPECEIHIRWP